VIVFESVYSMDGDIAPIESICDIAEKHNALTVMDEGHAVGLYGARGGGLAERDGQMHRISLIQNTLSKGFGVIGGYIAGSAALCDFIRSYGSGFIFTTSLPPGIAAAALASVRYLKTHNELREQLHERAETLKQRLAEAGIPVLPSVSHMVPVVVGDAVLCKQVTDDLLNDYGIYVQPIVYPAVPRGAERMRFLPSPLHTDGDVEKLVGALKEIWKRRGLKAAV
jgi:5-aminolevulinate synthase